MDKGIILHCFLWICPVFASNVDILVPDSLAYGNTCECGRDLTLPCKFKNKTFAIAWMNLNDISPIAQCVRNKCDINPKYIDQYNISYDETNHIFNLTIIKLTMKDNGRQLVCSDGTSTDSQLIRVKDNEPLLFENTTTGTIQAISGCISNDTNVSFKWIKICARSDLETEFTPKIQNASITSCFNDSDCGNDQQMQYSEVISAKASNNGNYFLKIVADYGNEQKESYYTVGRYMLEDIIEDEERSNTVFVVAVLLVDLLILTAAVYLSYLRSKEKKESLEFPKHDEEEEVVSSAGRLLSNFHCSVQDMSNEEDLIAKMHPSFDNPVHAELEMDNLQVEYLKLTCNGNSLSQIKDQLKKETQKERNEEEIMPENDESNGMSVNEPTVNDLSLSGVVQETDLSSKEQTVNDFYPDIDELKNYEKQNDLLAHQIDFDIISMRKMIFCEVIYSLHGHCLGLDLPEIEREKKTVI